MPFHMSATILTMAPPWAAIVRLQARQVKEVQVLFGHAHTGL
jgi:hypothetical protein